RELGVVVQKAYVFGTSIRTNIALGNPDASLEDIREAARLACIDDEIMQMPLGYDTPLIAGGGSLSGGQRQRIALARAVLGKPSVLVLDEATSALDSVTERRVQENLERLGCTRIVIAHRLASVVRADRILVMRRGRIVDSGTHQELLAKRSLYGELVRA